MNQKYLTLAEYIAQQMNAQGLSLRAIESASRYGGRKGITKSYINKLKNSDVSQPSPAALKALARGLNRPEQEIFDVVLGKEIDPTDYIKEVTSLLAGHERWSEDDQAALARMIELVTHSLNQRASESGDS